MDKVSDEKKLFINLIDNLIDRFDFELIIIAGR